LLNYSVARYLPESWSNQPLYAEKLIPLLDYALNNDNKDSSKMSGAFYQLADKYQNTSELPLESLKEYIAENGYTYILDLLNPAEIDIKLVVWLLPLIHSLKGSSKGIQAVLAIFQSDVEPQDTEIIEWFNSLPVGEENTFSINSKVDVAKAGENFFNNFSNFIKQYVYPELREFKVRYRTDPTITYIPYTRINIVYRSIGDMTT